MEDTNFDFIEEFKGVFIPFIPEICMIAVFTGSKEARLLTSADLFPHSPLMRTALPHLRPSKRLKPVLTSKAMEFCAEFSFRLAHPSDWYLPPYTCSPLHLATIAFLPCTLAIVEFKNSREIGRTGPTCPVTFTLLCATAAPAHRTVRMSSNNGFSWLTSGMYRYRHIGNFTEDKVW